MIRRNRIVRAVVVTICVAFCFAVGSSALRAEDPGGMRVTESGVGAGVVDRELQDRAEEFPEETEVWFWTRVEGGAEGDRLVHVWLRGGEEVHSHELSVGASHWRTWSSKKLHAGSVGDWTVEARNADGEVLASQSFRCTPAE